MASFVILWSSLLFRHVKGGEATKPESQGICGLVQPWHLAFILSLSLWNLVDVEICL